jgi:hypothetical protein
MNKNVNTATNTQKKKRKASGPRFNVFDFLIIFTILVCVGAIAVRAIFIGNAKKEITTAKVVFEVSGISSVTAEALCIPEQPLYLQSDDTWIGTVVSAVASPQKVWEKDETGMLQSAFHPEKKTVRAEAVISGTWSEDGFLIGGTNLAAVGKNFAIYTPSVSCTVTVVSVSENQ